MKLLLRTVALLATSSLVVYAAEREPCIPGAGDLTAHYGDEVVYIPATFRVNPDTYMQGPGGCLSDDDRLYFYSMFIDNMQEALGDPTDPDFDRRFNEFKETPNQRAMAEGAASERPFAIQISPEHKRRYQLFPPDCQRPYSNTCSPCTQTWLGGRDDVRTVFTAWKQKGLAILRDGHKEWRRPHKGEKFVDFLIQKDEDRALMRPVLVLTKRQAMNLLQNLEEFAKKLPTTNQMTDREVEKLVRVPVHSGVEGTAEWTRALEEALHTGRTTHEQIVRVTQGEEAIYLGGRWLEPKLNKFWDEHPQYL